VISPNWWLCGSLCVLSTAAAVTSNAPREAVGGDLAPRSRIACGMAGSVMESGIASIQGESRPRLPDSHQTQHFTLTYTDDPRSPHAPALEDGDADGIPDYVERLGDYFEQAWSVYMGEAPAGMAFSAPPLKSGARYVVYVYQLPEGFSGQTWPENKSGRRAGSHISIACNLYEPYVRAVAAHELFHAVQFGCNYQASVWWKEASAEWAADEVFGDVDTYVIPYYDWFQVPGWSLQYTDGWHEYGSSIWAKHLAETRGRHVIRAIWNSQRTENDSLKAMSSALEDLGTTVRDQFRDFAAWNWFTGERADGAYYDEGQLYPMMTPEPQTASNQSPLAGSLPPLASAYLPVVPPRGSFPIVRGLTLRLQREDGIDAQLILERKEGSRTVVPVDGSRYHVGGFEQAFQRAVLVFSNGDMRARHQYGGSVSLGIVYRDQYGYIWDLQVEGTEAVRGTVEVGDEQPWTVTGEMKGDTFHWRAVNPDIDPGERWSTGFDVGGSLREAAPTTASRWSNDTGRADVWNGTLLEGPVPPAALTNRRGPAQK
jgi:hypothetical protein